MLRPLKIRCHGVWLTLAIAICAAGCGGAYNAAISPPPPPAPPPPNPSSAAANLYTMSNNAGGNTVVAFKRNPDGTLTQVASYATGGLGTGSGLENQGALTLSVDRNYLYVVNPGSNDVSVFQITDQGLTQTARVSSGGRRPVSVTEYNGLVYLLNRGSQANDPNGDNISGLRLGADGSLAPIAGSTAQLSTANTDAAQIAFSPNGNLLVVTEHGGGPLDTYVLNADGTPGGHQVQPSAGLGPFGFAFRNASQLFVSEAGRGTVSSYSVNAQGILSVLSGAVSTGQATACWVVITPDQKEVYVSNTASGTISEFAIGTDGSLSVVSSIAATATGAPLDLAISSDGLYLYVLTAAGNIDVFQIAAATGALLRTQSVSGLPVGSNGLVDF